MPERSREKSPERSRERPREKPTEKSPEIAGKKPIETLPEKSRKKISEKIPHKILPPAAQSAPAPPRLLERRRLMETLENISQTHKDTNSRQAQIGPSLKPLFDEARLKLEIYFNKTPRSGLMAAQALAKACDQLIRSLYDFASNTLYPNERPSQNERLTILATGGYGRGELAPFSDLDLMFLIPHKSNPWVEQVTESLLYALWDMGFKLGHSLRSLSEIEALAKSDLTIKTALLEARFLAGDLTGFHDFKTLYDARVRSGNIADFIEEKLGERDKRHQKFGDSRYLVEPHVKDGKGGLRDLQTMWWIIRYLYGDTHCTLVLESGLLSRDDFAKFKRAEAFLWTIRFALHYLDHRASERLGLDIQRALATRLGYKSRVGLSKVERFMKHYFYTAKQVGDLTRIFCAVLEDRHQKKSFLSRLSLPRRMKGFRRTGARLSFMQESDLKADPIKMIEIFSVAEQHSLKLHPEALRHIKNHLKLIDDTVRADPRANQAFMALLMSLKSNDTSLRRMNEAGVFGRFIPDFGRVVGQMQYDMYHHYTVDEHSIRAVGILRQIENGLLSEDHPLTSQIIHKITSRSVLYTALLLHDIAKGRSGDHSILGADVARILAPRFGLKAAEVETVAWLVRFHLLMSDTAFKRDLSDPKTVEDFCAQVKSPERLKLLLILTVADIRAVGPNIWNGWKGQLLRELYLASEEYLIAGHASIARPARVEAHKKTLAEALKTAKITPSSKKENPTIELMAPFRDSYWIAEDAATQFANALLISRAHQKSQAIAIDIRTDPSKTVSKVSIYTEDRSGLFARLVGALTLSGMIIRGAKIHTTIDGKAMDNFTIQRLDGQILPNAEAFEALRESLIQGMNNRQLPREKIIKTRHLDQKNDHFEIESSVIIDNKASLQASVIEIGAKDRPGLLYDLAQCLFDLSLDVVSAHIATYGGRAVDVFYVQNRDGSKATHPIRLKNIESKLLRATIGE